MPDEPSTRLPPPGDPTALYVVDLSGYLFRAYHALPPLQNARGEATHAVLGVTTMMLKLLQDHKPQLLAMAMDTPGRSFRHELYAEYKAHRPAMPPDLASQLGRLQEIVEAYRFPVLREPGVEADDIIASLVKRARAAGLRVVIVSSDKDLLQLVGDDVWMLDTMRNAVFGPREVEAKLGVPPSQVRDYLALVGDTSDNVPGVPQVGPKTAATLLKEHGDLDRLYAALDTVERKAVRAQLATHQGKAFLSRELVSLKDDVPLGAEPGELRLPQPDVARLRELFAELSFTRLLTQLDQAAAAQASEAARVKKAAATAAPAAVSGQGMLAFEHAEVHAPLEPTPCICDANALAGLVAEFESAAAVALFAVIEGPSPVTAELVGLAFATDARAAYVPIAHVYPGCPSQLSRAEIAELLGPFLRSERAVKVASDSKREWLALLASDLPLRGVAFDTMLASYLIDPELHGHGLAEIARFELDAPLGDEERLLLERGIASGSLRSQPIETIAARAGMIVRTTLRARAALMPKLEQMQGGSLLADMELPLAETLAEMERTGVYIDVAHLGALSEQVSVQLKALEQRCQELAGRDFNVGSPRQLEQILFDELKLPVVKRTKTARSTDHDVLEELSLLHELPRAILEHRMLAKLKSTYLEALPREVNPKTKRIHTDFRQAVAATGRLSSSEPNLQNIPIRTELGRSIRDAFVPREGWSILSADYSQIELRVLAHLSSDEELGAAFRAGADVHTRTASAIFGVGELALTRDMRGRAKTVNYAVIYGQTQFALARNLRIERSEASRYIKAFFAQYAGVAAYMERIVQEATRAGEVRTLCGRVRKLPELHSHDRMKRQAAERVARNTPIQGSAADIIKLAMIAIARELRARRLESRMLLTVHDELVFEAPAHERAELEQLVRERMERAIELSVPLVVDLGWGATWGQAH